MRQRIAIATQECVVIFADQPEDVGLIGRGLDRRGRSGSPGCQKQHCAGCKQGCPRQEGRACQCVPAVNGQRDSDASTIPPSGGSREVTRPAMCLGYPDAPLDPRHSIGCGEGSAYGGQHEKQAGLTEPVSQVRRRSAGSSARRGLIHDGQLKSLRYFCLPEFQGRRIPLFQAVRIRSGSLRFGPNQWSLPGPGGCLRRGRRRCCCIGCRGPRGHWRRQSASRPAPAHWADATNGLTLAQPQVGLTLPASPTVAELTNSLTVAQPQVGLILPTTMDLAELTNGLTVAQPQVGLILPVSPDLTSSEPGLTLAEPVVQLQFAPSAVSAFSRSGPRLALVQVQSGGPNPHTVLLEWNGPINGTYTVETSTDLHTWAPVSAEVISSVGGVFQARCGAMTPQATFYRLRYSPKPLSNTKNQTAD
jgi:hypothetical protein